MFLHIINYAEVELEFYTLRENLLFAKKKKASLIINQNVLYVLIFYSMINSITCVKNKIYIQELNDVGFSLMNYILNSY